MAAFERNENTVKTIAMVIRGVRNFPNFEITDVFILLEGYEDAVLSGTSDLCIRYIKQVLFLGASILEGLNNADAAVRKMERYGSIL